jgi:hypothetical protein
MTQKEYKEAVRKKAKKLVGEYYNYVSGWTSTNKPDEKPNAQYEGEERKIGRAIQCAKIVAQQILDLDVVWYRKRAIGKPDFIRAEMTREFWEDVMKELNK